MEGIPFLANDALEVRFAVRTFVFGCRRINLEDTDTPVFRVWCVDHSVDLTCEYDRPLSSCLAGVNSAVFRRVGHDT